MEVVVKTLLTSIQIKISFSFYQNVIVSSTVLVVRMCVDCFPFFPLDSGSNKRLETPSQKAFCVLQFAKCKSVVTV